MFTSILVGYDGSVQSDKAFELGLELASLSGGTIRVVSVVHSGCESVDMLAENMLDNTSEYFCECHTDFESRAKQKGVAYSSAILYGDAVDALLADAEVHGVDHLVIGRRGKGALQHLLLGSVSRGLVERARFDITLAR